MTTVECRQLTFAYNGKQILDAVDLHVDAGEWVAVIGPNGSGKTTLLKIVAGMSARSGQISLGGDPIGSLSRRERARRIAVVPQTPVMPSAMPLLDYVLMGRTPYIAYWGSESSTDVATAARCLRRWIWIRSSSASSVLSAAVSGSVPCWRVRWLRSHRCS